MMASPESRGPRPLLRTTLGAVLRRVRQDQGRTLADVARAAKVSVQYLSEVERGRKEASSEVLAAVCDALRVELPDVLAEAGRRLAARRATVVRLDALRARRAAAGRAGSGEFRLDAPRAPRAPRRPGSGDVTCLLAA